MSGFSAEDCWKALILYGLNQATYKIALGKTLLKFCGEGLSQVPWDTLSREFFEQYLLRLSQTDPLPQQSNPVRQTIMENIVKRHMVGQLSPEDAVAEVGSSAFGDVIYRFHNLANDESFKDMFYSFEFAKQLLISDKLHDIYQSVGSDLGEELDARWGLLEGAFSIRQSNYSLANDIRSTYIEKGYKRRNITENVPFLRAYQGNICFYCGEYMEPSNIHVDHVLPRQVVQHDDIWNLVLSHGFCNEHKSDKLVGEHFLRKLSARNENIIGSNHPLKNHIIRKLGDDAIKRRSTLLKHYDRVREVLGPYYWGGLTSYNPETDPFYRRLITVLNNGMVK